MSISNQPEVLALADRLANLKEAYKADCDAVMEDAEGAGVDKPGLRRLVSWRGKDAAKRAEQEAIDDQYRFLAGDRPTPAELPPDCELAKAIALFRDNNTVRQVADTLDVSVGKAQKLRTLAKAFMGSVHVHLNVNKEADPPKEITSKATPDSILPASEVWLEITRSAEAQPAPPSEHRDMTDADLGDPLLLIDKPRAQFREKVRAAAASVKVERIAEPAPARPADTWDGIVRDHPDFLLRKTVRAEA